MTNPTSNKDADLRAEALILANYLIHATPSEKVITLYATSVRRDLSSLNDREVRLLRFGFSHPLFMSALDGGLALLHPQAELRRRIYIMFALLEATPEYHASFLPRQRGWAYVFVIALRAIHASLSAALGILLIKCIGGKTA